MKRTEILIIFILLSSVTGVAQQDVLSNQTHQEYFAETEALIKSVSYYFSQNREILYSLSERAFVSKIDSLRNELTSHLDSLAFRNEHAERESVLIQQKDIHYAFDGYILSYPYWHKRYTGQETTLSPSAQERLDKNLADFNKPELLASEQFGAYVREFLHFRSNLEREKPAYKNMDNQKLKSIFRLIPEYFTNQVCKNFWSFEYLNYHIENLGVKNIDTIVRDFNATCEDTSLLDKINALYDEECKQRAGHLIKTYKTVENFDLDLHLFLPKDGKGNEKRPAYIFFHGGSWTEGKPDWGFYGCDSRARSGWVAVAVEYRINDRHGTLPFEAVMDARSAIRWLRKNAAEYGIDVDRIVASGNSAGGHLVLCTALADKWNEKTDDLHYSATPNILLINSGVFDLTDEYWITKDLKDKAIARQISPNYLVKKGMPPTLFIHGTNDRNVPFQTAKVFEAKMIEANNDFEFHALEGAGHFIWFDEKYSKEVSRVRSELLKKYGYR